MALFNLHIPYLSRDDTALRVMLDRRIIKEYLVLSFRIGYDYNYLSILFFVKAVEHVISHFPKHTIPRKGSRKRSSFGDKFRQTREIWLYHAIVDSLSKPRLI